MIFVLPSFNTSKTNKVLNKINFNGKIIDADQTIFYADNRAFKYGDGLFETIRVFNGKIPFLDVHFKRLEAGLLKLKYEIPDYFSTSFFETETQKLVNGKGNHRVRLTVFRTAGGFYTPTNNHPLFLIESSILNDSIFELNKKGLHVGLYTEIRLPQNYISNLKTCNSLPYILAGIHCKKEGFDDCFLLNNSGNIAECVSSNVFIVKNETILTPSLSEACVSGTMRKIIIEIAKAQNIQVEETSINVADLKDANEVWLSNAIQGIRWVEIFNGFHFENKITEQFVKFLNDEIKEKVNKIL
jgi:branched-chain amino acid aminotransferase